MNIVDTKYTTNRLGAPTNWDEARDGKCETLPTVFQDGAYHSFWLPSAEDLTKLNAGIPICLSIFSATHPVVSVHMEHEVKKEDITEVI